MAASGRCACGSVLSYSDARYLNAELSHTLFPWVVFLSLHTISGAGGFSLSRRGKREKDLAELLPNLFRPEGPNTV